MSAVAGDDLSGRQRRVGHRKASNALLAFNAAKLRAKRANSLIACVPVGQNPIGEQFINGNKQIVVANSDSSPPSLMVIDTQKAMDGKPALVGSIRTRKGPRELDVDDGKTLQVTNFGSAELEAVPINDIPLTSPVTAGSPPPSQCPSTR